MTHTNVFVFVFYYCATPISDIIFNMMKEVTLREKKKCL